MAAKEISELPPGGSLRLRDHVTKVGALNLHLNCVFGRSSWLLDDWTVESRALDWKLISSVTCSPRSEPSLFYCTKLVCKQKFIWFCLKRHASEH